MVQVANTSDPDLRYFVSCNAAPGAPAAPGRILACTSMTKRMGAYCMGAYGVPLALFIYAAYAAHHHTQIQEPLESWSSQGRLQEAECKTCRSVILYRAAGQGLGFRMRRVHNDCHVVSWLDQSPLAEHSGLLQLGDCVVVSTATVAGDIKQIELLIQGHHEPRWLSDISRTRVVPERNRRSCGRFLDF